MNLKRVSLTTATIILLLYTTKFTFAEEPFYKGA
jgi:hypothetical protein